MERAQLRELLGATGCVEERGDVVFLCDPGWSASERAKAEELMAMKEKVPNTDGWVCVRTGGSGGGVKFARHDERTLSAAVNGFCVHFGLPTVNAVDVLPAHHVSGLMSRLRCAATGGMHMVWDWKKLESGERPSLPERPDGWVISLVPTQLQRLMASTEAVAWLRRFDTILLGGGAVWPGLSDAAARAELRVSLTYGMTETAAMVAALRPEDFLSGERNCGTALPHVRVSVNADGVVKLEGESLFRGYYPASENTREFVTEDLGRVDGNGRLHIVGRRDAVIITGGKKVQPAEVEAALRASGEFADVAVIGVPDAEWGQTVIAFYPESGRAPDLKRAAAGLASHQRPKRFVALADWPRNAAGKLNRAALAVAAGRMGTR